MLWLLFSVFIRAHPWLVIISRFSLDSLDFATNGSRRLVFEIDCKGTTKMRFFHTLQALSEVKFVTLWQTNNYTISDLYPIGYKIRDLYTCWHLWLLSISLFCFESPMRQAHSSYSNKICSLNWRQLTSKLTLIVV